MKRTFICLLALFVAAASTAAVARAAPTEITAAGSASVSLPPDVATVNATVQTSSDNANAAVVQSNQIYDRVVAAVTKLGVARSDIVLGYYNIRYNPRPSVQPPNPSDEPYGYTVVRNFLVKVREIGKAGAVSDACVGAGVTSVNGIDFGLSNPNAARSEAIAKAVDDARAGAQAMARAAGLRIVGLKSVELGERPTVQPLAMARVEAAPTNFDQSNVSVSVSVTAVFLAQP